MFTYNNALGQFVFVNDNDDDDDKGGGGGGNNNSNSNVATKPKPKPWESEFGGEFDPDKAWEALQNARRAERTLKKERDDLAKSKKEIEDAEKSDLTKAQERIAEMEKALEAYTTKEREAKLRASVAETAKKEGALYPDDVYALIRDNIDVDSDGKVTNAVSLIKELKSNRSVLFSKQVVDKRTNETNGENNGKQSDFNTGIRALFGR